MQIIRQFQNLNGVLTEVPLHSNEEVLSIIDTRASTVIPSKDISNGDIGVSTDYARADHCHPILFTYGTEPLEEGVSELPTGTLYFQYEITE